MKQRQKGICRWCGKPVNEKRRTLWHEECVRQFHIITIPWFAYKELCKRDGQRCRRCGRDFGHDGGYHFGSGLEVDHIVELVDAPRELRYWGLENLQLLCHKCHALKTGRSRRNRNRRQNFRGLNLLPQPTQMNLEAKLW